MTDVSESKWRPVILRVTEQAGINRARELVRCGLPLARGKLRTPTQLQLRTAAGELLPLQTSPLSHWTDGSIQWLLLRFPASPAAHQTESYSLDLSTSTFACENSGSASSPPTATTPPQPAMALPWTIEQSPRGLRLLGRTSSYSLNTRCDALLTRQVDEQHPAEGAARGAATEFTLKFTDDRGRPFVAQAESLVVDESGPLLTAVTLRGKFGRGSGLRFRARIEFLAEQDDIRWEVTIENPSRAQHRDNYWDLGDPGSVLIQSLALQVRSTPTLHERGWWQTELTETLTPFTSELQVWQESSGGEQWNSRNHRDRSATVPLRYRGYRVTAGDQPVAQGERANPVICTAADHLASSPSGNSQADICGIAPLEFWEKFPTAVTVRGGELSWELFPARTENPQELQGGEHCTRIAWFGWGNEPTQVARRLRGRHRPLVVQTPTDHPAHQQVIPHLPTTLTGLRSDAATLLGEMLAGEQNFFRKREVIDEFGWRNFGDVWADHEEAYCDLPRPVISHYNNQYDLLFGFLLQFLLTGDERWWQLADPLARHLIDIDIYHARNDKSAYSGGLFWHTMHYLDAMQSTHRCVSRSMMQRGQPVGGGGPGNEHNYSRGLTLYYFLTGDSRARDTVIGLADWVIAMDQGSEHLLGILSDVPTGNCSSTVEVDFHGPGRGAGNSIHALLDGWLLTRDARYLNYLEQIVRRTIHPADDLAERNLLNVEFRWSYTVYLQALDRYLVTMRNEAGPSGLNDYVRASLLHYADWMAKHEANYLDNPSQLEYPTETWAAQDLRKGLVLQQAASWAVGTDRTRFWNRGQQLLDKAWQQLMSYPSRAYSRPSALVLSQCYIERSLTPPAVDAAPSTDRRDEAATAGDFGSPTSFIAQKRWIKQQARSPRGALKLLLAAARPGGWIRAARRSWVAERLRRWLG